MMKGIAYILLAPVLGAAGARLSRHSKASELASGNSTKDWSPRLLPGKIEVNRPAFLMLDEAKDQILIAQFGRLTKPDQWWNPLPLLAKSSIAALPLETVAAQVSTRSMSGQVTKKDWFVRDNQGLQWPNVLSRAPASLGDFIVVPDGFLPPGKSDGDLFLARPDGTARRITTSKTGTFYHEVEWHDFNGDGLLDILTCRATKTGSVFTGFDFTGELLWLENPGKEKMDQTRWAEHKINDGPDVIFKSTPYKGGLAIFATEFWNAAGPRLSVHFVNAAGELQGSRTIDDTFGKPFAVSMEDVDGDGVRELLVTNHQGPDDEILPAIYAYEVDWKNLETASFPRHTLTYGPSENKVDNRGVGAPGFAHSFYPTKGMSGPKYIYAAGDGAFDVWILKPTGKRFEYETLIIDINGTTGQILEHDFDGDGVLDLLIPDNDFWGLHVITFE